MRKFSLPAGLLLLCAAASIPAGGEKSGTRVPVLLELFTSEGCSDCPPADRLLGELDQNQPVPGAELIVLSEHVDYWNQLGWKDPYSSPQSSARQQEYASKFSRNGVYTPQLVVDGRFGFVGSDGREAASAIQKAIREPKMAIAIGNVTRAGNQVAAHIELPASAQSAKGAKAVLYVAIAENKTESQVTRGENSGRHLVHVGVVRSLQQAGSVDLDAAFAKDVNCAIAPGIGSNGLRLVAFLQDPRSGRVLGVAARKF